MKINIETIPHNEHRSATIGDYWIDENGVWQIRASELKNEFWELMLIAHELIEFALIRRNGKTEQQIAEFDLSFEERIKEQGLENAEPGFADDSPYLREHSFATSVEMGMCAMVGENWTDYELYLNSLYEE